MRDMKNSTENVEMEDMKNLTNYVEIRSMGVKITYTHSHTLLQLIQQCVLVCMQ